MVSKLFGIVGGTNNKQQQTTRCTSRNYLRALPSLECVGVAASSSFATIVVVVVVVVVSRGRTVIVCCIFTTFDEEKKGDPEVSQE